MNRIEINVTTGERTVVELTPEEIAALPVPNPNDAIVAQINALEARTPFTHRYFREQLLATVAARLLPADHPVAAAAIAEDAAVQALRGQLK